MFISARFTHWLPLSLGKPFSDGFTVRIYTYDEIKTQTQYIINFYLRYTPLAIAATLSIPCIRHNTALSLLDAYYRCKKGVVIPALLATHRLAKRGVMRYCRRLAFGYNWRYRCDLHGNSLMPPWMLRLRVVVLRRPGDKVPSIQVHTRTPKSLPQYHMHLITTISTACGWHTRSMLGFNIDCFIPGVLFSDPCTDLSTAIRERQLRCW